MNNESNKNNLLREKMKALIVLLAGLFMFLQDLIAKFGELISILVLGFTYILKTLGIALAGGFADYIISIRESNEEFSFKKAFFNTFIAGFAGFLSVQLCLYFNVDVSLMGFLCGISGFAGVRALKFFESMTKKISEALVNVKFKIVKEESPVKKEEIKIEKVELEKVADNSNDSHIS